MTTDRCHITTSEYSRLLFSIFWSDNWFWFVLPVVLFAALGLLDWRYFVVALMTVLVVIPMVMALIYFNYMLTVETRWSIVEKTVSAGSGGLLLNFGQGKNTLVGWKMTSGVYVKGSYVIVKLNVRRYQYLVFPRAAFVTPQDFQCFARLVSENLNR